MYSLCEDIYENFVLEEGELDFIYVELGWNCFYLEDIELYYNDLMILFICLFELLMLKYLNVFYNDI